MSDIKYELATLRARERKLVIVMVVCLSIALATAVGGLIVTLTEDRIRWADAGLIFLMGIAVSVGLFFVVDHLRGQLSKSKGKP